MLIRLDPSLSLPLYEQLAASVRAGIASGEIEAGEKLPGARELAASLAVNVHTVLRGYNLLREEGLLDLRRGRGAVVTGQAPQSISAERARLATAVGAAQDAARRLGLTAEDLSVLIRKGYPS